MKMDTSRVRMVTSVRLNQKTLPERDKPGRCPTPGGQFVTSGGQFLTPGGQVVKPNALRKRSVDDSAIHTPRSAAMFNRDGGPGGMQRAHTFIQTTPREKEVRRKQMTPKSTQLSVPELKSILKCGNGMYALKARDAQENVKVLPRVSSADAKYCYRLPNQKHTTVRKSVSFLEDSVYGASRARTRPLSSPVLSVPVGVFRLTVTNGNVVDSR